MAYTCDTCGASFGSAQAVRGHQNAHRLEPRSEPRFNLASPSTRNLPTPQTPNLGLTSGPLHETDDTLAFLKQLNAREAEREAVERRAAEAKAQEGRRQREAQEASIRAQAAERDAAAAAKGQREAQEASIREARRKSEADTLKQQIEALEACVERLNSPLTPPAQVAPGPREDEDDANVDEEGEEAVGDEVNEGDDGADDEAVAASGSGWGSLIVLGLGAAAVIAVRALKSPASPPQP